MQLYLCSCTCVALPALSLYQLLKVSCPPYSSQTIASEDEEYDDVTVNQMLAPRTHETDATQILNNLLKEYDKKLRPDIGGEWLVEGCALSEVLKESAAHHLSASMTFNKACMPCMHSFCTKVHRL